MRDFSGMKTAPKNYYHQEYTSAKENSCKKRKLVLA